MSRKVFRSRPTQKTCAVEHSWLQELLPLLEQVDVPRLLGVRPSAATGEERAEPEPESEGAPNGPELPPGGARRNDGAAVSAARQRFLERKKKG